jgi:hypothetical protein
MKIATLMLFLVFGTSCFAQDDPLLRCLGNLGSDPRFSSIADKLSVGTADTTFAMLADTSLANDTERQAIATWATARSECVKGGDEYWRKNYPIQIYAVAFESENTMIASAVDLYNRKISFGEFNKRRDVIKNDVRNKVAAIVQQILNEREAKQQALQQARDAQVSAQQRDQAARQEAQRQYEQAQQAQDDAMRRQAAMSIFLNNMRPNQAFQPIQPYQIPVRPSVNTNCYRIGDQVNCTTR